MIRRKRRYGKVIRLILFQMVMIGLIIVLGKCIYHLFEADIKNYDIPAPEASEVSNKSVSNINISSKQLVSRNAILIRMSDHKIILNKKSQERIYPASLTKIMTAIVAIENLDELDQSIQLSPDIFPKLYDEDASIAGFLPNETVSALDLLYGILLPSGAECCIGLSDYIAGSESAFVRLMNEKAADLEMNHTHFTNTTGLNNEDHYTTVADLSKLLTYALQNKTFLKIFTSASHTTASTSLHPDGITFYSTMFSKMSSPDFTGGSILGGKTGYTREAGLCLASLAQKNNEEYILITAGAKGNHDTEQYNITDALKVYRNIN